MVRAMASIGKYFNNTRHRSKWFVLSSRPTVSFCWLYLKSSYPSPPLTTRVIVPLVSLESSSLYLLLSTRLRRSLLGDGETRDESLESWSLVLKAPFGTSTDVKNRTWPVCPCGDPVGPLFRNTDVLAVIEGRGLVNTTPALVPIHNKSLQINNDVTRKQAALCCLIIASAPGKNG